MPTPTFCITVSTSDGASTVTGHIQHTMATGGLVPRLQDDSADTMATDPYTTQERRPLAELLGLG